MYIQLSLVIKPLQIGDVNKIDLSINQNGRNIDIIFEKIPTEKLLKGYESGDLIVKATANITLNAKRAKQFEEMKSPITKSLNEFIKPIHRELMNCVILTIKGMRWRLRSESSTNPIKFSHGLMYSHDRGSWKSFPDQIKLVVNLGFPYKANYTPQELLSVEELISEGIFEPIAHELLHEAWELRKNTKRSALVIGIAAAETGFKNYSSILIPEASWLILNVPSPPLEKMLQYFLPQTPAKNTFNGKVVIPPESLLNSIKKGISLRNAIVHRESPVLSTDTVEEVLNSVRDLLYLLDFYQGHTWARDHISHGVLNEMIAKSKLM